MKIAKWKVSWQQKGMLPNVRAMMPTLMGVAMDLARTEWIKVARANLRTSKDAYVSGIREGEIQGRNGVIRLVGWLPNAIEQGLGPFDMKPGFLRSPKAHGKQGNKYFNVPFQLRAPGSAGGSPPVMPQSIYNLASKLRFGQSLQLPKIYEGYGLRSRLSQDMSRWGNYTWQTSPFQGITRERRFPGELQTSSAGRMAQYKTFRRVSSRSDRSSWIHPGFRARDLMEKAVANYESKISEVVSQALGG
jgi:hypothetical protein